MEAESRAWRIRCPRCGTERSIWDAGGIRYRAAGNPRRRMPCAICGQPTWHRVYRLDAPDEERSSAWVVWLVLAIIGISLLSAGLIAGLVLRLTGAI